MTLSLLKSEVASPRASKLGNIALRSLFFARSRLACANPLRFTSRHPLSLRLAHSSSRMAAFTAAKTDALVRYALLKAEYDNTSFKDSSR